MSFVLPSHFSADTVTEVSPSEYFITSYETRCNTREHRDCHLGLTNVRSASLTFSATGAKLRRSATPDERKGTDQSLAKSVPPPAPAGLTLRQGFRKLL